MSEYRVPYNPGKKHTLSGVRELDIVGGEIEINGHTFQQVLARIRVNEEGEVEIEGRVGIAIKRDAIELFSDYFNCHIALSGEHRGSCTRSSFRMNESEKGLSVSIQFSDQEELPVSLFRHVPQENSFESDAVRMNHLFEPVDEGEDEAPGEWFYLEAGSPPFSVPDLTRVWIVTELSAVMEDKHKERALVHLNHSNWATHMTVHDERDPKKVSERMIEDLYRFQSSDGRVVCHFSVDEFEYDEYDSRNLLIQNQSKRTALWVFVQPMPLKISSNEDEEITWVG